MKNFEVAATKTITKESQWTKKLKITSKISYTSERKYPNKKITFTHLNN